MGKVFVLVLVVLIAVVRSQNCIGSEKCDGNQDIGCSTATNDECIIDCRGERACYNAIMTCRDGGPAGNIPNKCTVNCDGYKTCRSSEINCIHDSSSTIDSSCHINCMSNSSNSTSTSSAQTCQNSNITCGDYVGNNYDLIANSNSHLNATCQVECSSAQACYKSKIVCNNNPYCFINCTSDDNDACANAEIYCPSNENSTCDIVCNGVSACKGMTIYCYNTVDGCDPTCIGNGADVCGHNPPIYLTNNPTVSPTENPTVNPIATKRIFVNMIESLKANTWIFALIIAILSIIGVIASKLHEQNIKNKKKINNININNDGDNFGDSLLFETSLNRKETKFSIYAPIKDVQHFIFIKIGLTLFDLISDTIFGFYLYYLYIVQSDYDHFYFVLSVVYAIFLLLMFLANVYVTNKIFNKEFSIAKNTKYNEFADWFNKYASKSALFRCFYILSFYNVDCVSIFYCHCFKNKIFFAPFCFDTVKYLKQSIVCTILLENIPQLVINYIVVFKNDTVTSITFASMFVGIVDIIAMIGDVLLWRSAQASRMVARNANTHDQ